MKRPLFWPALAGLLLLSGGALAAGPWTGAYVGFQAGINRNRTDHYGAENAFTLGINGGYDYQVSRHFVAGGDLFFDDNAKRTHSFDICPPCGTRDYGSRVYGIDGMLGFPVGVTGRFMPYLKVGYGHMEGTGDASGSDSAWRAGAGLQWRATLPVSVSIQYMHAKYGDSDNWKNDNFTLGVTYHFRR